MFIGISFTPVICGNNDVVYTTFRPDDSICSCNLLLGKYAVMTELPPRSDEVMNSMDNNSEESEGYDIAVVGHTHQAGRFEEWYFNSGSWVGENNEFLTISPEGKISFHHWKNNSDILIDTPVIKP